MYGSLSKVLDDSGFFFKESFAVSPFIDNFFGDSPDGLNLRLNGIGGEGLQKGENIFKSPGADTSGTTKNYYNYKLSSNIQSVI